MPFPITFSFELDAGLAEPVKILNHLEVAATKARMDIVERGPTHLVLSSSFMKVRWEETLPMMTATRCELRIEGPEGRRRVKIYARFGECVQLGACLGLISWIMAFFVSPVNAYRSLPVALLGILCTWVLLYLYAMLDVRVWTRARIEDITTV
jgi:hypothetical protein